MYCQQDQESSRDGQSPTRRACLTTATATDPPSRSRWSIYRHSVQATHHSKRPEHSLVESTEPKPSPKSASSPEQGAAGVVVAYREEHGPALLGPAHERTLLGDAHAPAEWIEHPPHRRLAREPKHDNPKSDNCTSPHRADRQPSSRGWGAEGGTSLQYASLKRAQ